MNNRNRLTIYILAGLVLGIVVGYFANAQPGQSDRVRRHHVAGDDACSCA